MARATREGRTDCGREIIIESPSGEQRHVMTHPRPLFDEVGRVTGAVNLLVDVTEQTQALETIREQAALLDAASDAIYVRDLQHTIIYWNKGAETVYGWTRSEALGRKANELFSVDEQFTAAHEALLRDGTWSGELTNTVKPGNHVHAFCRWTLVRDDEGRPKSVLVINTDMTEKQQLLEQFHQAQHLECLGTLASEIAHDLNNILTSILMTASLVRESIKNPEDLRIIDLMEGCALRGAEVVKQILAFARGLPGNRGPVQLRRLFQEMTSIVEKTFPRNIAFKNDAPKDLWLVQANVGQLHQVLMNLCINARDAMPDGGSLSLRASNVMVDELLARAESGARPGPHVCVTVADTGCGIPADQFDKISTPFFTTKDTGKGTGLGLSTVLSIVKNHAGFVKINSKIPGGTVFQVYLPAQPEMKPEAPSGKEKLPPKSNQELVLLVDDEIAMRNVIERALTGHGYRVLSASNGFDAANMILEHRSELRALITDATMPLIDGPGLVRRLKELEIEIPVICMSELDLNPSTNGLRENLTDLGVKVFLQKPFQLVALLWLLHRLPRPSAPTPDRGESLPSKSS